MATINCCCFNQISSPPPPPHSSKTNNLVPSWRREELGPWKRRCIVGMMACMIINGSEMGALLGSGGAVNINTTTGGGDESDQKKVMMMRWSDKRACPPWRMNSFETIVPENLPRASAHRRSESVRSSPTNTVKVITIHKSNSDCFTM